MAIQVWGLDDGYGDIKGFNGKDQVYFPSNVTNYKAKHETVLGEANKKVEPLSHIVVEFDGKKFLVGEGARKQDMSSTWVGGNNKHKDVLFPALAKTALAMLSEDYDEVTVDPLVLGLPVEHEDSETRHKLLNSIFWKTHEVKLTLADGSEFIKTIRVKDVLIVKQPFGSFCDLIMDDEGNVNDPELATKFVSIVDIGAGTVNYLTLDDLDPMTDLTTHTNQGMYEAYTEIGRRIEEEFGKKYAPGKLPEVVKQGFIAGGHNIQGIVDEVFEIHASKIVSKWETMFRDSLQYVEVLILTGGGSIVLKSYLEKALAEYEFEVIFLGVHNTARGLRKYGLRQAKKKGKTVTRTSGGGIKITNSKQEVAATKDED